MSEAAQNPRRQVGLASAIGANLIWGLLPLYLFLVREVPPVEFVGWRIIWTLPFCILLVWMRRQWSMLKSALSDRRTLGWLTLSATLIGANWLIYIWAIQNDYVYAASMGYYLNPMLNVLLGTLFLGEKLSRRQWIAVALASAAIGSLLFGALSTLWISVSLAGSFGTYGLVRKQVPVGAVPGLTVETILLLIPASCIAWWFASGSNGSSFATSLELSLLIMAGGALTAIPLMLFAIAAKRLRFSTLGFIQFLSPTIVFVLGLTVFDEPLDPAELGAFILVWIAIAIFVSDLFSKRTADGGPTPPAAS